MSQPLIYLDPGSGSYLLQLLVAGALGLVFALRVYWSRIKRFLLTRLGRQTDDEEG